MSEQRPPLPPFTYATARRKVQALEDLWNRREPTQVVEACREHAIWIDRSRTAIGRQEILELLTDGWQSERECVHRKRLWTFEDDRIAVRFRYDCVPSIGQSWRSLGNEFWEFDADGLIRRREATVTDLPITESERSVMVGVSHW
jgi:uncharacterized protein